MVPVGTGSGRTHIMPAEDHPTPTGGRSVARRRRTGFSGRQFRPIRGRPMSGQGQTATWLAGEQGSGKDPEPDPRWPSWFIAHVPDADLALRWSVATKIVQ